MQLAADQELRRELLLVSLSKRPDLEEAINFAAQMEEFVLRGFCARHPSVEKVAGSPASVAELSPAAAGNGSAKPQVQSLGGRLSDPPTARREANGSASGSHHSEASSLAPGGQKRRWSTADDERLRKLWQSDHSLEEIAEAMGRTTPSLYSRARALGMSKRTPPSESREAVRPARSGRESASGGAEPAPTSEDDIAGKAGQRAATAASKPLARSIEIERYSASCSGSRPRPNLGSAFGGNGHAKRTPSPAGHAFQDAPLEAGVEPIIHFLRSRDYSVVRVEDGRFKVDGRHVLDANELREKANKVRQSLGQRPFAPHSYGSHG